MKLSACCCAPLRVSDSGEGTNFYVCTLCNQPTDPMPEDNIPPSMNTPDTPAPQWQRITPENPPQFPCWLYAGLARYVSPFISRVISGPLTVWPSELFTHWHPDQPDAPQGGPVETIHATPVKSAVTTGATQDAALLSGPRKEEAKASAVAPFNTSQPTAPKGGPVGHKKYCYCGSEMGRGVCLDGAPVICKERIEYDPPAATQPMPASGTPRTDAVCQELLDAKTGDKTRVVRLVLLASQLERELAEAKARCDFITKARQHDLDSFVYNEQKLLAMTSNAEIERLDKERARRELATAQTQLKDMTDQFFKVSGELSATHGVIARLKGALEKCTPTMEGVAFKYKFDYSVEIAANKSALALTPETYADELHIRTNELKQVCAKNDALRAECAELRGLLEEAEHTIGTRVDEWIENHRGMAAFSNARMEMLLNLCTKLRAHLAKKETNA